MEDSIQDRVFALVAHATGVRKEKLTLNTALNGDIGLDGDDAAAFFDAFRKEFAVELEDLHLFWNSYFAPEGMTLSTALLFSIPGLVLGVLFTHIFPHLPDWACFVLAYLLTLVSIYCAVRWGAKKRTPQIFIQDLIDSATAHRWIKKPPIEVGSEGTASRRDAGIFER